MHGLARTHVNGGDRPTTPRENTIPRGSAASETSGEGLTTAEARRRLATYGPNATPDEAVHPLRLIVSKFVAPVPGLLEAAIVLQLVLGEYVEASVVAVLLIFNAALGFLHENRAQATVAALKARLALVTSVHRDGGWKMVPAAELVPGDVVKLSLGAVVGADVRITAGHALLDQSTLTGESQPIEADPGYETYAGALVRRGEAVGLVTATGARTKFGKAAELVRTAHIGSAQQKAVLKVVRNLALVNGVVTLALLAYALSIGMPLPELLPLLLVAVLGTVPVALPATFTLATALGARALARSGVLPTRLSAVDEAASMDILCSDKTGTLTHNTLAVTAVRALPGFTEGRVLALAALASSEGGQDPVDRAVRTAAPATEPGIPTLVAFTPFDPAVKMSEAVALDSSGARLRIVKGAFATVMALCESTPGAAEIANALELDGRRVLGVGVSSDGPMQVAGLLALSDPPRDDAAPAIAELKRLGVRVAIVSGDAPATTSVLAKAVGLTGPVYSGGAIREEMRPDDYAVFAGVLPEDKFHLVKAFQREGHTVGMCGDGANDAPALRQAQIGIAVSTATDAAKSAAGVVLTDPGLGGIVAAVREGRVTFQRILTYTLRSLVQKVRQVLFLAIGLVMTGHAILTPMLMVLSLVVGDFLAMSATTDNVEPSSEPNKWRIGNLTIAAVVLGLVDLVYSAAALAAGMFWLGASLPELQALTLVMLVFNGQAVFYVARERRRMWASRPSAIVVASSVADILVIPLLAWRGILMAPLPLSWIGGLFGSALVLAFVLDMTKVELFRRLRMV
ncbi:HAD-IC family P-type ATPase [Methylobacterium sp. NEAU K]|uniref:HAD-IC family P-type ATPase n=1 Tax=Methylobacterium sp. NEAU K TaxID=3064946 RepID=UPI0027349E55|nr:HAD-IC family P-type ATPase [Methylobacterium sp. NEAU K]MDP4006560.1 HAD-IC family P-type ATPase [Methylobacterium sp. NEAU K]